MSATLSFLLLIFLVFVLVSLAAYIWSEFNDSENANRVATIWLAVSIFGAFFCGVALAALDARTDKDNQREMVVGFAHEQMEAVSEQGQPYDRDELIASSSLDRKRTCGFSKGSKAAAVVLDKNGEAVQVTCERFSCPTVEEINE